MRVLNIGLVALGIAATSGTARAASPAAPESFQAVCDPCNMPCGPDSCSPRVAVGSGKLELRETVHFDTGRASIHRSSYALLDEVAYTLKSHREIKKVRVEGYTDDVGGAELNQKLSQQRAEAVKTYLVKKGVDRSRLETKGYGESRPVAKNDTPRGRRANRRVDFLIE